MLLAMEAVESSRRAGGAVSRRLVRRSTTRSARPVLLRIPDLGGEVAWSPHGVFVATQTPAGNGMVESRRYVGRTGGGDLRRQAGGGHRRRLQRRRRPPGDPRVGRKHRCLGPLHRRPGLAASACWWRANDRRRRRRRHDGRCGLDGTTGRRGPRSAMRRPGGPEGPSSSQRSGYPDRPAGSPHRGCSPS